MTPLPSIEEQFGLAGHVVTIFGSGPGIGIASARVLASAGAHVACVDLNAEVVQETVAALEEAGAKKVSGHVANVTDRGQVREILAAVADDQGRIDGVLDVVGRSLATRASELSDDDFARQLDVNLTQQLIVAQESLPHLQATRGSFVAISSINGLVSAPHSMAYGIAKAGVHAMVRTMALELGGTGVRFNAIAPGSVRTKRAEELGRTTGELGRAFVERIPLGRLGEPYDIAGAAYYLLSPLSSHVTGQILTVDGGSTVNYALPTPPAP